MDRLRVVCVACFAAAVGCSSPPAVLLSVSGDQAAQQYDLYVRDDKSQQIVFHSGFNPVQLPTEAPRDITTDKLKIALALSKTGNYTLLLVGVIGDLNGAHPAPGAVQMFWAGRVDVEGTVNVDARLLTVPDGDDADGDLWPDASSWPGHSPEGAMLYGPHPDLLDCNDKIDNPTLADGTVIPLKAAQINPFAVEICGDGYDENCDGNGDEACVDNDKDHDFAGDDCDDNDPARHHPTDIDPFPDPPNCCGYNLGKANTPDAYTDYLHDAGDPSCFAASCTHDMLLCPMKRCGDGIDESCRGMGANDPNNDTTCVVDDDCDGYPAPPQGNDCDDHNPNIHPGAKVTCGLGIDQNCSGVADQGCVPCDLDGDGYERVDQANGCPDKNDKHPGMVDCNDYDSGVYPGMTMDAKLNCGGKEGGVGSAGMLACSLRGACRRYYEDVGVTGTARVASFAQVAGDADCNGVAYEGCPPASCDADGDGWPNANAGCNPNNVAIDCNDMDPTTYPGAPDKCGDGKAQNCVADMPCGSLDKDGDGYIGSYDCDDTNAAVHPWATEVCNGIDDDCDGLVDEGNPDPSGAPLVQAGKVTACTDSNVGECGKTKGTCVCSASVENVKYDPNGNRLFCPGENPPGAQKPPHCYGAGQPQPQSCDATNPKDDDCDGRVDAPDGVNLAAKGMPCGISVGQCKAGIVVACDKTQTNCFESFGRTPPSTAWYVCSTGTVCPQAELCNGLDDDCDGQLAGSAIPPIPGLPTIDERDHDSDHYIACGTCAGLPLATGLLGCNDCDDTNPNVHPGAKELCNNINDACDPGWAPNTVDGKDECPGSMNPNCCSSQAACRNLATDFNNCTACGNACSALTANACGGAGCMCGGSTACTTGNWCNAGACNPCNTNGHCGLLCVNCGAGAVCKTDGSGCTQCNTDGDCDGNHYCMGGACLLRQGQGGPCGADDQCVGGGTSLFCTDGRCCTSSPAACNGCKMCNSSGTCVNVAAGQDPHSTCTANLAACQNANCDGNGGCNDANGTVCVAQACSSGQQTVSTCQGGSCTAAAPVTCAPYICSGNACLTSCGGSDANCVGGYYCAGNTCTLKKGLGSGCSAGNQCGSNNCVDGVCCSSSSCGQCLNCAAGSGMCTAVVTNGDDLTPNTCTGASTCDAMGACKLKDGQGCGGGTACASGFCVNGVCCNSSCNGGAPACSGNSVVPNTCSTGNCNVTPTNCNANYTCDPNPTPTCATSCTCATAPCQDATRCASTAWCDGAACQAQLPAMSPCTQGFQCMSGNCNNGQMKCQ
jgi:hypothetical protein